ncbi:ABC transporter ATP-binding protein [Nocardia sp. NPDC050799]|uniref:ABC transporter ATP-binding protein n=1 Tax=Nocardia sp. NPDC050799 TaxID=3154842 RepID=UPI0033CE45F1
MTDAIQLNRLSKHFGDFAALDSLDLTIPEGQFVTLLGPSGSGKTTALRCLAGLEQPTGGEIHLAGALVCAPGQRIAVPPEKRGVGFVFQNYALWPHMTVRANVEYPLRLRKVSSADRRRRAEELLGIVGLDGQADKPAADLSGGQQQRVALARALANDSPFMLYDEPLSNLDAQLRTRTRTAIRDIHDRFGTTTVYVTHDQDEAFGLSDRVVVMNRGRVEQDDHPETIYARPASAFVARFVGFENIIDGGRVTEVAVAGATVVLPDGLGTCLADSRDHAVGADIAVAVRAHDVVLGEEGSGGCPAVVQRLGFSSGAWEVVLAASGRAGVRTVHARVGAEHGRPVFGAGDRVTFRIRPGRAVLLPAGEQQE